MKNKGFTLIELLVVIAIIGLLASIVLVSLNSARTKTRNTKRNADIQQLKTAFNMAADSNSGNFVSSSNAWVCVSKNCYDGFASFTANSTVDAFFSPYMTAKPDDPVGGNRANGGYLYRNSFPGGDALDGYFAPGAYFTWILEPTTVIPGVCGPGRVWTSNNIYLECMLKLD